MKNFVVGDVHGSYDKLMLALETAGFRDSDNLYFTGDICDRGTQNKEVMDFFLSLGDRFKGCFGNHDIWLYLWLNEETSYRINEVWMWNGGYTTVDSFKFLRDNDHWVDEEYRIKLLSLLGNLRYIWQYTPNIRVMHTSTYDYILEGASEFFNLDIFNTSLKEALDTGFIQNRAYDEQVFDRNVLYSSNKIYGTDMEVNSFGKDKPLTIIGHTPLKEVTYCDDLNILCIDTAGFLKDGRISVVDMGTFKCYDSDKKEFDLNLIEPSLS